MHTSFRAVRPVEGGPRGLIDAFRDALGPAGTLVMPSWTGDDETPFDPASTPASSDLGIVADTFWRLPGVVRSDHPFACAAAGPHAASSSRPIRFRSRRTFRRVRSDACTTSTARFSCSASATTPTRRSISRRFSAARPIACRSTSPSSNDGRPSPHRLRRERPLLSALRADGRLAALTRSSGGRKSRQRPTHVSCARRTSSPSGASISHATRWSSSTRRTPAARNAIWLEEASPENL